MERLPHEILKEIFDFLDPIDLFSVSMVCKAWNKISGEDKLWMKWKSELKSQYFQWLKKETAKFASGKTLDWIHSKNSKKRSVHDGNEPDYVVKLLLAGDPEVGKTSIMLRLTDESFLDQYIATIGIDFKIKNVELHGKRVKLQIWDTAGQERFRKITTGYFRGSHGIMFVYDVSNRESFEHLKAWFKTAEMHSDAGTCVHVGKIIVGNKQDTLNRAVTADEAKEFAAAHGCPYFEVSAKTGENITHVFLELLKESLPDLSPPPKPPSEQLFLKRVKAHSDSTKEKCIVS